MLSRYFRACVWMLLGLWLAPAGAASDDRGTDHSSVVERLVHHYTVEADGSYRLAVEDVRRVVTPQAGGRAGRRGIDIDPARDRVESVDAWTQTPGGQRIPAAARADMVSFAHVAPGDRLVLRYVLWRRAPRLAGQFDALILPAPLRHRDFQVIVDLPAGRALHADAVGFTPVADAARAGRQRYRWRYVDGANPRSEAAAVSQVDEGRRLALSTFADYRELASTLRAALATRAAAPPALVAQALSTTEGLPDAHARAQALARWRARLPAQGDDADAALMLKAVLAAAGIDSALALVNDANTYTVPNVPTLAVFNHVVVFVPGEEVYLDPATGGPLPRGVLGKPALRLDTGRFGMTPVLQAGPPDRASVAAALLALAQERGRRRTWVCPAIDTQEEMALTGARAARPRPVSIVAGGLYYSAQATRGGAGVILTRRLTFRHGTPTCTAEEYRVMRPALERIRRDLLGRAA